MAAILTVGELAQYLTVGELAQHFCSELAWPARMIKDKALTHGNVFYAVDVGTYVPAAIKLTETIIILNESVGIREIDECIHELENAASQNQFTIYKTTMGPVKYPGDYPPMKDMEVVLDKISEAASIQIELIKDAAEVGGSVPDEFIRQLGNHEKVHNEIREYKRDREQQEEYERFKELLGIDEILKKAIKKGSISKEDYERIKSTYDELQDTITKAEDYIKKITSIEVIELTK